MAKADDYLTKPGAHRLANQIRRFWARKGHLPGVRVEPSEAPPRGVTIEPTYSVRSDMVNGRPR